MFLDAAPAAPLVKLHPNPNTTPNMTPRFYGTPTAKAATVIRGREEFLAALRENDQSKLLGVKAPDTKAAQSFGFFENPMGLPVHKFEGFASYLQAATGKVWCTARAIDIVANVVLSTDMQVVHRDPEKKKKKKAVRVAPELSALLANPNPHDTISEVLYLWVAHMKATGNAFWFLDNQNAYGQPEAIYPLNPKFVRIVASKTDRVSHYIYSVNGSEVRIETSEMIHFKRPHADSSLFGLGEIEQGESIYNEFINRGLYNTRFIANGASPSSILVNESFEGDQEEWDKLRAKFEERYGGVRNTGKTAWVNGKWSLLQLGLDAQKMQEMEKAKVNKEDIFLNHGVPLSVAGFSNAANYATAKQDDISFRKLTVLPLLNLFCDAMNSPRGLIARYHTDLKLDFSLTGLVDVEQVMKDHTPLVDRGGMTLNELREKAGLPRVENPLLDQFYILSTLVPLEMSGLADIPPLAPATPGAPGGATPPAGQGNAQAQNV